MSQQKPRKFTFSLVQEPQGFNVIWEMNECDFGPIVNFEKIHVIEASYAEGLERELEEAKAEIEKYNKRIFISKDTKIAVEKTMDFTERRIEYLKDSEFELREKLAKLEKQNEILKTQLSVCKQQRNILWQESHCLESIEELDQQLAKAQALSSEVGK